MTMLFVLNIDDQELLIWQLEILSDIKKKTHNFLHLNTWLYLEKTQAEIQREWLNSEPIPT